MISVQIVAQGSPSLATFANIGFGCSNALHALWATSSKLQTAGGFSHFNVWNFKHFHDL